MARRLQELLGIAQAEHVVAGIKLQAAQGVGHHALAALHADERMWDAVVKALTPKESQTPQSQAQPAAPASTPQKPPAKPVATLEDIRATLLSQGEDRLAKWLAEKDSHANLLEVAEIIEATSWEGGTKAATMANVAVLLREMAKGKTEANPAPKRDWMDSGGSSGRLEFGGSSRNV
jgi:hypothetical protein